MSELCKIHGVPLSDWLSECPACKAEKKRHDEALDVQREQRDALNRQTEQLREADEAEAERAMEAQWALDDLATTSKARLEEDRTHREAEASKAMLRAGVRELTPALQLKWQQACAGREQVYSSTKAMRDEKAARSSLIAQLTTTASQELESLVKREGETVQRALSTLGPSMLTSLPEDRLVTVEASGPLSELLNVAARTAEPFLLGRAIDRKTDPTLVTSLWPALKTLEEAHSAARAPSITSTNLPGCVPWAVGIVSFGIGAFALTAVVVLLVPNLRHNSFAGLFVLGGAVGAGVLAAYSLVAFLDQRAEPYRAFSKALENLRSGIATNVGAGTLTALQNRLAKAYVLASVEKLPGNEAYLAALRHRREATGAMEIAAQADRDATPQQERVLKEYEFLRKEVMRVGREIVEGIRAPGRLLQATNCCNCGGPITSETKQCPYCRSGLPVSGEV